MKEYEKPKMEIIEIELDDIIMTSGEPNDIDTDDIDF